MKNKFFLGDVVSFKSGKFKDGDETKVVYRIFDDRNVHVFEKGHTTFAVPCDELKIVEPGLRPGQKVLIGRHRKRTDGSLFNWDPDMDNLVGTENYIFRFHGVETFGLLADPSSSAPAQTAYYIIEGRSWCWLREALTPVEEASCAHVWVNVGFVSIRMACKHCGVDRPD